MAEQNVIIRRYQDNYTLLGRDLILMPMDRALDSLLCSGFMREWLKERMMEHLERGGEFVCRAEAGTPKSVYKLASAEEIMDLAAKGKLDQARQDSGMRLPRRSGKVYKFVLPSDERKLEKTLSQFRGQGRIMLELVAESGQSEFSVAALEALLEAGRERLKTKPERKLLELFRFHLSESYKKLGVVEVEDHGRENDETAEEDDETVEKE